MVLLSAIMEARDAAPYRLASAFDCLGGVPLRSGAQAGEQQLDVTRQPAGLGELVAWSALGGEQEATLAAGEIGDPGVLLCLPRGDCGFAMLQLSVSRDEDSRGRSNERKDERQLTRYPRKGCPSTGPHLCHVLVDFPYLAHPPYGGSPPWVHRAPYTLVQRWRPVHQ